MNLSILIKDIFGSRQVCSTISFNQQRTEITAISADFVQTRKPLT